MTRHLIPLLLSLLLAGLCPSARAQYTNTLTGMQFNNMYAANADFMMTQMIRNAGFQSLMASTAGAAGNSAPTASAPPAPQPPAWRHALDATDFRPAGPRRVPEQMAEAAESEADRAQLLEACRGILAMVEESPDFRRHNLAYAMTLALGISAQLVRGAELDPAEEEALLRTVNDTLAEAEVTRALAPEDLTRAYDTFLITGGLMAGIAQHGAESGDAEQQRLALAMARSTLAAFGVSR